MNEAHHRISIATNDLELELQLGQPKTQILSQTASPRFDFSDDPTVGRSYASARDQGIELNFENECLSAIFIFLVDSTNSYSRFTGSLDLFPATFFSAPSAREFAMSLEKQGFKLSRRKYPFALDYLNEHMRLRYEERPSQCLILIDSGSQIRS